MGKYKLFSHLRIFVYVYEFKCSAKFEARVAVPRQNMEKPSCRAVTTTPWQPSVQIHSSCYCVRFF